MKQAWKYLLFFLLCLAVFLVLNLPVRQLLPYARLPATIGLAGVSGTVVHGKAREVSVNRFPLRDVRYRFEPTCMLLLKACYRVEYEQGTAEVAYDLLNGDTEVNQLRVEYPAADISGLVPNLLVQPDGLLELNVDEMTVVGGKPVATAGHLIWHELGIQSDAGPFDIGDYRVDFTGGPQKYEFKLSDVDASLDVDGKGDLDAGGQYRVEIRISSAGPIDPRIKNMLDLFANTISYNNYRFDKSGRLPPNVTRQLF